MTHFSRGRLFSLSGTSRDDLERAGGEPALPAMQMRGKERKRL